MRSLIRNPVRIVVKATVITPTAQKMGKK